MSSYKTNVDTFNAQFNKALSVFKGTLSKDMYGLVAVTGQSLPFVLYSFPESSLAQNAALHKLGAVDSAYWRSDAGCLNGTRTALIQSIGSWVNGVLKATSSENEQEITSLRSRNILWLYGLAGSGKSTIAHTVAKTLTMNGLYLTCYFCARDGSDTTPPRKLFPTIAHQLALLYAPYREALVARLGGPDSSAALNDDFSDQRKYLFEDLLAGSGMAPFQPLVIVVDGLDNCGSDRVSQTTLACNLSQLARTLPWIKLIITSRDRPDLRTVLDDKCYSMDIKTDTHIHDDIRLYVEARTKDVTIFPDGLGCSESDIKRLVAKADGLFEWCSVVFRYLSGCVNPSDDLEDILSGRGVTTALQGLYALYDNILKRRFTSDKDVRTLRKVLGVIFIALSATQPLSVEAIAAFLQPDDAPLTVQKIVHWLSPVLHPAPDTGLVRAHHLSFLDYVESKMDTEGWPQSDYIHEMMAIRCLQIMRQGLRFNICGLNDASLLNRDVPDLVDRMRNISATLTYGALHWMTHVASASKPGSDAGLCEHVRGLVCHHRVLYWLELLSLLERVRLSVNILDECRRHFAVSVCFRRLECTLNSRLPQGEEDIERCATDAYRFVRAYSPAMASTPHLYLSALSWLPTHSPILERLPQGAIPDFIAKRQREAWDEVNLWTQQLDEYVCGIRYSPSGRQILVLTDRNMHSRSAATGESLWSVQCRVSADAFSRDNELFGQLVIYSPDGTLVASATDTTTASVFVHDARTGRSIVRFGVSKRGPTERYICTNVIPYARVEDNSMSPLITPRPRPPPPFVFLAFSSDGKLFMTVSKTRRSRHRSMANEQSAPSKPNLYMALRRCKSHSGGICVLVTSLMP